MNEYLKVSLLLIVVIKEILVSFPTSTHGSLVVNAVRHDLK
jgi:hypothetical protein